MDDRQLRAELETLQHQAKSLRTELTLEHAPGFVEKRDELQRLLESTEVLLKKESDERNTALRQERDLRASITAARSSLAALEQRRLSPLLILVPFAAFFFLPGHDLLRNKPLMWIAAVLSAAVLGFIAGSKLGPRNTDEDQGPLLPTLGAPVVTHLVGNGTMWGLFSLLISVLLFLVAADSHGNTVLWFSSVQAAALVALGLAASSTTSTFALHRWAGWLEVGVSWLVVAAMPLYAVLTRQQVGSGTSGLLGLVVLAAPVLTAALRIAHTRWPLRHRAWWVAPLVASVVLSAVAGTLPWGVSAALALAGQLALAGLLFAFTIERWKGRLIAAAPLLLFVGVVFALKR